MELFLYICHQLTELFGEIAPRLPAELVEPVEKMINRDVRYRPTAQLFMLVSPRASGRLYLSDCLFLSVCLWDRRRLCHST